MREHSPHSFSSAESNPNAATAADPPESKPPGTLFVARALKRCPKEQARMAPSRERWKARKGRAKTPSPLAECGDACPGEELSHSHVLSSSWPNTFCATAHTAIHLVHQALFDSRLDVLRIDMRDEPPPHPFFGGLRIRKSHRGDSSWAQSSPIPDVVVTSPLLSGLPH